MTLSRKLYFRVIDGSDRRWWAKLGRVVLTMLSGPYRLVMWLRNLFYDWGWLKSTKVKLPVIVVGNLSVGGTGKTPAVEWLCRRCIEMGEQPVILSRGYGSQRHDDVVIANDEALVLAENLPSVPHLQGKDRVSLATQACQQPDTSVLVLDDGFQYRKLQRNLDIILIDATCPFGYGHLLPRGLLRESIHGLKRAGAVIITRSNLIPSDTLHSLLKRVKTMRPNRPIAVTEHTPVSLRSGDHCVPLADLKNATTALISGIGNPQALEATLIQLGATVSFHQIFADHHPYSTDDVRRLITWANNLPEDCRIVTTQKDFVKLAPLLKDQATSISMGSKLLWCLQIEMTFRSGEKDLTEVVQKVLQTPARKPHAITDSPLQPARPDQIRTTRAA